MSGPYLALGAFLLVWVGAGVALVWFSRRERQRKLHAFAGECARRLGGTVSVVPLHVVPEVQFPFQGEPALVRMEREGGAPGAIVEYELPVVWVPVVTVRPCTTLGRFIRFFRIDIAETGDPSFDRDWTVESSDAGFVVRLLDGRARDQVRTLARWAEPSEIALSIAARRLKIECARSLRLSPILVPWVEGCNAFAALVFAALGHAGAPEGAIRFVDTPATALAVGSCQVCGEPVEKDPVLCARCRTPHHRECWDYLGGCSTFACAAREYVAG